MISPLLIDNIPNLNQVKHRMAPQTKDTMISTPTCASGLDAGSRKLPLTPG